MKHIYTFLCLLLIGGVGQVGAFSDVDLEKLKSTNECKKCDFSGANLEGARLRATNLAEADLTGADLTGADFYRANLENANLTGANLAGANLIDIFMEDTTLQDANLTGANLTKAYLEATDLTGANLTMANLAGAFLEGANLECPPKSNSTISTTSALLLWARYCGTETPARMAMITTTPISTVRLKAFCCKMFLRDPKLLYVVNLLTAPNG